MPIDIRQMTSLFRHKNIAKIMEKEGPGKTTSFFKPYKIPAMKVIPVASLTTLSIKLELLPKGKTHLMYNLALSEKIV